MKYLRKQTGMESNPVEGVIYNVDTKTVSYISPTRRDFPKYFTVYPLNDGTLTIKAYFKGTKPSSEFIFSPSDTITVDYLGSNSSWTSISFSNLSSQKGGYYVIKTIPLVAGQPINLKSSTGLCVLVTSMVSVGGQTPVPRHS